MKNISQSLLKAILLLVLGAPAHVLVAQSDVNSSADLTVSQQIRTNQFTTMNGDTLWSVRPDETYIYKFTIQNNGDTPAFDVILYDFLPDSVYIKSEDLLGELYGDTLMYYFEGLYPGQVLVDSFKVTVFDEINDESILFINTMIVESSNEDSSTLADNYSVSSIGLWRELPGSGNGELVLSSTIWRMDGTGDSFVIHFNVQQQREMRIDLFDISGYKIDTLLSDTFSAGWHSMAWDGFLKNGGTIGSGVYVMTLRSDDALVSWKKFMVQR